MNRPPAPTVDSAVAQAVAAGVRNRERNRERQRAHRARRFAGEIVLILSINEVAVTEALIARGFLSIFSLTGIDEDDREKIAAALTKFIDNWAHVTRDAEAPGESLHYSHDKCTDRP